MGRFPETYNDPKFIIQRKQLGKKYIQIDISMTVISLRKSLDLAADSFFVLVRTYQLQSKTYLIHRIPTYHESLIEQWTVR